MKTTRKEKAELAKWLGKPSSFSRPGPPKYKNSKMRFLLQTGGRIQCFAVFGDASKADMGVAAYVDCKLDVGKLASQLIFS